MKLFEPIKNCNTKALCRVLNDGIILEDGKLLFLNTEEGLKKEYFGLQENFLSMDAHDLFLYGEKRCATPVMEKKTRIIPFSKQSLLFQYTEYWKEPIFYFWIDEFSIGSCTLSDIRSFYEEPMDCFIFSNLGQLRNYFERKNCSTLVLGNSNFFDPFEEEVFFSEIMYFKDTKVWLDHRIFVDFDWISVQEFEDMNQNRITNLVFPSLYKMRYFSSYYGEVPPCLVFRFFEQEIQVEEIVLLQKEENSKYVLYSKGCTFSKEEILLHQKVKCLKKL